MAIQLEHFYNPARLNFKLFSYLDEIRSKYFPLPTIYAPKHTCTTEQPVLQGNLTRGFDLTVWLNLTRDLKFGKKLPYN